MRGGRKQNDACASGRRRRCQGLRVRRQRPARRRETTQLRELSQASESSDSTRTDTLRKKVEIKISAAATAVSASRTSSGNGRAEIRRRVRRRHHRSRARRHRAAATGPWWSGRPGDATRVSGSAISGGGDGRAGGASRGQGIRYGLHATRSAAIDELRSKCSLEEGHLALSASTEQESRRRSANGGVLAE
ncbi:hypothetical protein EVAR_379_1 [Eumeta japonica]|uniref:Uncharacterized protein n=1 Tax=Eumeta variegata TaxID=151549 RepID=A0A4C1SCU2_EUMVA|nr:hypothetical protein EVAR_379_1 [Eumeta japonica]